MKVKVLILCTGNSCRSQMAHGFLQSMDSCFEVHSAGTRPSSRVNPRAVEVMNEVGIDLSSHTPKSVDIYLGEAWDCDYCLWWCQRVLSCVHRQGRPASPHRLR